MKTITPESAKELIDSLGGDDLDTIEILCGFGKDLQTILAEGTVEVTTCGECDGEYPCGVCNSQKWVSEKVLKPEVAELFLFIKSLNLK